MIRVFSFLAALLLPFSFCHAEQVIFSEVMYHGRGDQAEFIEIQNLTSTVFDFADWKLSEGVEFSFPPFEEANPTDAFLKAFERIIITETDPASFRAVYDVPAEIRIFGPWEGNLANGGERITLKDKNGVIVCTMRYDDDAPWPILADGTGHSLVLQDNSFAIDDYRIWTHATPTPGFSPPLLDEEPFANPEVNLSIGIPFVTYSDAWDFNDQNIMVAADWNDPDYLFGDSGWTMIGDAGNNGGLYGFENAALPAPGLQTPLLDSENADNHITYYFRKEFSYSGPTTGTTVTIDTINDDAVYFYLNGVPIGGAGIHANAGWKEEASRTITNAQEELAMVTLDGSVLVEGTNILAAQVHQTSASSSDCVFGARLSISAPAAPSVVINEVFAGNDGYIEFYNPTPDPIDLSGWYLSDDPAQLTKSQLTGDLTVQPSGLLTVNLSELSFTPSTSIVLYLTEGDGSTIANAISATLPDTQRALGRKPSGANSWFLFSEATPGSPNTADTSRYSPRINEIHVNPASMVDWVEIYNPSPVPINLSSLLLSDSPELDTTHALSGTIAPLAFLTIPTSFATPNGEISLFLADSQSEILDAWVLNESPVHQVYAAYPDGTDELYASATSSPGEPNQPTRHTDIVISELMVDPPTDHRDGEFIELYNRGAETVDLSGWSFSHGVNYTFPIGSSLAAGEYLVIAANKDLTSEAHPSANIAGQYDGELSNSGELLRLVDRDGNLADSLHFNTGGQWPTLAGGQGSSLELIHPDMDNSQASAWAASDEADKSTFQTFTITDRYEQLTLGDNETDSEELHLQAVGDAHLALRNMSLVRNGSGGNILPNQGETVVTNGNAATGWLCQGTHYASHMSGSEFHLISDGHGDVKANRCEIDTTAMVRNDLLTFTFDARWVSGKPTLVVVSWDRSFGDVIHLPVPKNLGTPGQANSSAMDSPIPTVNQLLHSPAVPSSQDPVKVTARVSGATEIALRHRLDKTEGNGSWLTTPMADDGTNGDEVAEDGIYTATLNSYQSDNAIVQFYVEASSAGGTTTQPRFGAERPAMWVVDNTSHPGDLRTQRFVISAQDTNASGTAGHSPTFDYAFPRLSNHYFNATFIGNEHNIIYNCELRKSGSPWTRSNNADFSRAKWKPPGDRPFRGYRKRSIDNDAGSDSSYNNRIIRYWLYLFGHVSNENEFIRVIINGGGASLREDAEPNSTDFLKRNWENGHLGELYRIDDEWWFDDDWGRRSANATWRNKGTSEAERYSSEWIKRSRESEHDYSSFVNWVESVGSNSFTRPEIERMADIDMMAANAVIRGWCDDWDTLTRNRGKNGYFLRRVTDGKWMLIQWDSDRTFGDSNAPFFGNLSGVRNFFDKPYVRQRVNYYLGEMIDNYTHQSPRLTAWLQCEEDASSAYSSNTGKYNTWNANRISRAETEMGSAAQSTFTISSGNGSSLTTSAHIVNLAGSSPHNAFSITVTGQAQAEYQFNSQTSWSLSGIILAEGENPLVLQALDANSEVIATRNFTVNKTGNAPPIPLLSADPGSYNVSLQDSFSLDASASFDPEGTAISYAWSITPSAQLTHPTSSSAELTFTEPGLYTLELTLTDSDQEETIVQREITVYSDSGWTSFRETALPSHWTPSNLQVRDGSFPNASYTLNDRPSTLTLKVEGASALPLTMASPSHPALWHPLPADTDWILQTDLVLDSIQQGDFFAGLIVELTEDSTPTRYTFGMEDGDFLRVKRATGGSYSQLKSVAWDQGGAIIRIRKTENFLYFDYRTEPGVWENLLAHRIPPTTSTSQGGLFAGTDTPQAARLVFDYVILIDPSVTSPTLESLRLTEIMYQPLDGSLLEYLEFQNTGETTLNLEGVHIDDGSPISSFTFGDISIEPGGYGMLVANTPLFQSHYTSSPLILGEWSSGALSNGGEEIVIRDPNGNIIHQFRYDDDAPWPTAASGTGASLEVIDPEGDYASPDNWRASALVGGSPGSDIPFDADNDGLSNLQEEAAGSDPLNPDTDADGASDGAEFIAGTDPTDASSLLIVTEITNESAQELISLTWISVPGKTYEVQESDRFNTWLPLEELTAIESVTQTTVGKSAGHKFYRIVVIP